MEKKSLDAAVAGAATDVQTGEMLDARDLRALDEAEIFLRKHNINADDLNAMLEDEASAKRLVRKVDWLLMPLLCGTFLLQYIDKQSLSYAAVFDLFESTDTNQNQYSWLVSLFYFGLVVHDHVPCHRGHCVERA